MALRNMPQLLSLVDGETDGTNGCAGEEVKPTSGVHSSKHNLWRGLLPQRFNFFGKGGDDQSRDTDDPLQTLERARSQSPPSMAERPGLIPRRLSRKVVPGLPRPQTFTRQNSERRERLCPVEPCAEERRAVSVDRRTNLIAKRPRSPPPVSIASLSAPEVGSSEAGASTLSFAKEPDDRQPRRDTNPNEDEPPSDPPPGQPPPASTTGPCSEPDDLSGAADDILMQEELDSSWILNLSMHFRDKSDREKFFVTYAAEANRWQRVTVSCDYRDALPDSLEADLKSLHYQRDKSCRIYEAIHDSLPGIQFYDTVTNLKLQTEENRLHVHVTEDVNEIIDYPPVTAVHHLKCAHYPEESVHFEAHLSGFVYKVEIDGRYLIKKEIPGPDTVDEFLYELNALNSLSNSPNVIHLEGIVVSNDRRLVKGLVISLAERGALVDLLYDEKGSIPWGRRERWAYQVVQGLNEIHEAGFVQGDFTLSNIVIDKHDDARIIDINRRGCPVGWEPPELAVLIDNGQRISMHIGVKTDLFQLGMVLWALARGVDEPERQEKPLGFDEGAHEGTPRYFQDIVRRCLNENPRDRLSAKELLTIFPPISDEAARLDAVKGGSSTSHRSDKEYIDPDTAIKLEDIEADRRCRLNSGPSEFSTEGVTYADGDPSTDYRFDSSGSCIVGRGRSNVSSGRRRNDSPYARPISSTTSDSEQVMHRYEHAESADLRWETVEMPEGGYEVHAGERDKDRQEEPLKDGPKIEVLERSPHRQPLRVPSVNDSRSPLRHKRDELDLKASARSSPNPSCSFPPPPHQDSGFDESLADMTDTGDADSPTTPVQNQSHPNYVLNSSPSTLIPDISLAFSTPRTEIRVPTQSMLPGKSISPSPHRGRTTRPRLLNPAAIATSLPATAPKSPRAFENTPNNPPILEPSIASSSSGARAVTGMTPPSQQWFGLMGGTPAFPTTSPSSGTKDIH